MATPQNALAPQALYQPTGYMNLDGMNARDWLANYKGTIRGARDFKFYDTRFIAAGGTVPAGNHEFFKEQIGQSEASLDGGATITNKQEDLTNALVSSSLTRGNMMIVDSIQCQVIATARDFATITNGRVTAAAPAVAGTTSASNNLLALHYGSALTFKFGNKVRAEGRIGDFPSETVVSGVMGAVDDEGVVQFGVGVPKHLREIVILPSLQFFSMTLRFPVAVTFAQFLRIEIGLSGLLFESIS